MGSGEGGVKVEVKEEDEDVSVRGTSLCGFGLKPAFFGNNGPDPRSEICCSKLFGTPQGRN